MSESATQRTERNQQELFAGNDPQEVTPFEAAEAIAPIPDDCVDTGDGSLTFSTLVATRDGLLRQADELAQLVRVYDRAIAAWTAATEREAPLRRRDAQPNPDAFVLPTPGHAAKSCLRPSPPREEPSIIVAMDSPAPVTTRPSMPPPLPIGAPRERPLSSREFARETIRFASIRPPRRESLMWAVGIGIVLAALTMRAGQGVSSASSGQSHAQAGGLNAVSTHAADVPAPQSPPVEPSEDARPEGVASLPKVFLSRFAVVWGNTPEKSLHVAVQHSISKLESCLAQTPHAALEVPAKLDVLLRVRQDGAVKWMRGVRGKGGSSPTEDCIENAFRDTFFPRSQAGLLLNTQLVFMPSASGTQQGGEGP